MRLTRPTVAGLASLFAAVGCGCTAPNVYTPASIRHYDVRILRDTFGVPHIRGHTDADVAYGVAYAQAEDDYPTMEAVFIAARGRNGAVNGKEGAVTDYLLHLMRVREAVTNHADSAITPATKDLLEGYVAGFNKYAALHPSEVSSVARDLYPITRNDIIAGFVLKSPLFYGFEIAIKALNADLVPPPEPGDDKGSNGFAVAPSRSGDGTTRLMSNSHQPWAGAVAWYELTVHSDEGLDMAGANFPGAPLPLLGHNKWLGWTNTVNRPDLVDTYRLRINPQHDDQYSYDGNWRTLERERVWLHVKMGWFTIPVPKTVEYSVYGPVIRNKNGAFALRYAGIDDVRQVNEYYALTKAKNWNEFRDALRQQSIPATNFIYADNTGRVAMIYNALFPQRNPNFDWAGILPGDTSATRWTSYVPFDSIPMIVSPRSGYVFNSNNTPFRSTSHADDLRPSAFPKWMGIEETMTNRAHRDIEMLDTVKRIDRAALLRAKFDVSYSSASYAGRVIRDVQALDTTGAPLVGSTQRLLRTWDLTLGDDRPASTLGALIIGDFATARVRRDPMPDLATVVRTHTAWLDLHYHRLDPPLTTVLRIRRGATDVGIVGGSDATRAVYWNVLDDGHMIGTVGDSFIMLAEWDAKGAVHSESIHQYGAATSRPASKHYADQLPLFVKHQWKPVPFTEAAQRAMLEREYRPGEEIARPTR